MNQRKNYYKYLSSITKKEIQITKCGGDLEDDKCPKIYTGREKNKYSYLEQKGKQNQVNEKNTLSIVDIGMEKFDSTNSNRNIANAYSLIQMHFHKSTLPSEKKSREYR